MEYTHEQIKQYNTLAALHRGISKVSELGANAMWCDEQGFCAVATLFPVESSNVDSRAKLLSDPSLWAMYDKNVLYMTGNANNAFQGTPEKRRTYMLRWIRERMSKIEMRENIITEGSDLRIPHFQVPEAAPVAETCEVVLREGESVPELIPV